MKKIKTKIEYIRSKALIEFLERKLEKHGALSNGSQQLLEKHRNMVKFYEAQAKE